MATRRTDSAPRLQTAELRRSLSQSVVLPALLAVAVAGLFLWQIGRLLATSRWVDHTDEVIAQANHAQKLLIDMETGERGYMIAGRPEFLEPYREAQPELARAFARLRALVADNPGQIERLEAGRAAADRWSAIASREIEARDAGRDWTASVVSGEGKRAMDAARFAFAAFTRVEEGLRDSRARSAAGAARRAIVTGLVSAVALGALVAFYVRRRLVAVSRSYSAALDREREQREWLNTTLTSIGDAVIVTDRSGRVILMNPMAERITGWPHRAADGKPLREVFRIVNEETRAEVESPVDRVIREGTVVGLANHTILIAHGGQEIPIDDSAAPILDTGGGIAGVVLVFRDVTERRDAERRLHQQTAILRAVSESTPDFLFVKDRDGRMLMANPAMAGLTGRPLADVIGRTDAELFDDTGFGRRTADSDRRVMESGRAEVVEEHVPTRDGPRILLSTKAPYRDADGSVIGLIVVSRDITDRKRVEQERLESLARERLLRAESEEAHRLKDEFFANASHELRTPLSAIVGWTRLLRSAGLDGSTAARGLEAIDRNAQALAKLIEELLDTSRIIAGKLTLELQPVDLGLVVAAAVNDVRPAAGSKGIAIEAAIEEAAGPVLADASRLQQIVWNLLSNAVKFTPRGGRVAVEARRADSEVEIVVRDTGEGMSPAFLPHAFERFRQADGTSTRRHGGLGLGLSIVHSLVELHGGTASAHSAGLGEGAEFRVRLPLMGVLAGRDGITKSSAGLPARHDPLPELDGLRVLVVDDDRDTLDMLRAVLSRSGAEVLTAGSAADAIRHIEERRFDALVSDIGMPDVDGYALIRTVRAIDARRGAAHLPALALTAYAKAEDRSLALAAGYQRHLSKPVEPADLVAAVASLVDRAAPGSPAAVEEPGAR